jgi:hypothetical protein
MDAGSRKDTAYELPPQYLRSLISGRHLAALFSFLASSVPSGRGGAMAGR